MHNTGSQNSEKVIVDLTPKPAASEIRALDFSQAISSALAKIRVEGNARTYLFATITRIESGGKPADMEEAKTLAETLDQLVDEIQDKNARDRCLEILSRICSENVILPTSYVLSDITLGERWRTGGVADTFMAKHGEEGVCIKVFRKHDDERQAIIQGVFYHDIVRWKHIGHENVLPFVGISKVVPPFGIVSPRMPNSNILEYTRKNQRANRLQLLENAACGLEYLHSLEIVHSGVNPGNILITDDGTACLGDFQIAGIIGDPRVLKQCRTTICRRGVVRYMAPEQANPGKFGLRNSNATKAADVHSFAMTAYEVLTGIQPYPKITGDGPLVECIVNGARPSRPEPGTAVGWLSDETWGMMVSCWAPEPLSRPPIKTVHRVLRDATSGPPQPKTKPKGGFTAKIRNMWPFKSPRSRRDESPTLGGTPPTQGEMPQGHKREGNGR